MQSASVSPFDAFLLTLENEIRTLKSMVSLSCTGEELSSRESVSRLEQIESSLFLLEEQLQDVDCEVDAEISNIIKLQLLSKEINCQGKDFDLIVKNAPSFLFHSNAIQENICEPQLIVTTNLDQKKIKTISSDEFETVPKSTRGRLTLNQINDSHKTFSDKIGLKREVTIERMVAIL